METLEEDKRDFKLPSNNITGLHHDLEKLQQSHDLLLHQLEDNKLIIEKLENQLSEASESKLNLQEQLKDNREELEQVLKKFKEASDKIQKLTDNEAKFEKMKMLAVKLKKDLSTVKEELEKSQNNEAQLREQAKANNKDKISLLYQQTVKNYQTLQSEYDQVQDTCEQLKVEAKNAATELSNTINELAKFKEELANCKMKNDNLTNKVNVLMNNLMEQERKTQDLEGSLIVVRNELEEERKKTFIGIGLEKGLEELKNQLDIKTNQVVDLEVKVDELNKIQQTFEETKSNLEACLREKQALTLANHQMKTTVLELEDKVKNLEGEIGEDKVKLSHMMNENISLETKLKSLEEQCTRKIKNLELQISQVKESLTLSEEELKRKDDQFESYKIRVCKLLNEKTKSNTEIEKINILEKKIEVLIEDLEIKAQEIVSLVKMKDNLELELRSHRSQLKDALDEVKKIDSLNEDNSRLKALARDLQTRLVSDRDEAQKKAELAEKDYNLKTEAYNLEISDLKKQIVDQQEIISNLQKHETFMSTSESKDTLSVKVPSIESLSIQENNSNFNLSPEIGDLESSNLDSPSLLPPDNRSSSFTSTLASSANIPVNPLHLILNLSNENDSSAESKQVKHLNDLLKESESSNILLSEQNRILKEEIRRLQRSIERVELVENMEYLKNIMVKFVASNSERIHLIPVLKTILKLNKQEESLFVKFASNSNNLQVTNSQQEGQSTSSNYWSNSIWNAFS